MSEEEINATMQMIGTEFPNTKNWLKWHVDNGRGPLIFPSLSKEFISGFGRDTNGQEGTGGWIKRSCATKHPNLVQGLEHLAIIGRVIENDLANEYAGFPTRYGAYTNPIERREVAKLKRKKKHSINDNDGRPPDTTRHAPNKTEYGVNGLDLRQCIPWSFNTLTPTKPHVPLHVTNTCAMDTILMCLYLMRKFNTDMLEDFIHEGLLVNNVLNLINNKEFDQARMDWISAVIESGNIGRDNLIRDGTTDDGSLQWDCWGNISDWHCNLKMTKFVEKDSIGCCDVCNRDGEQEQAVNVTSSSTSIAKEKEVDIGDACIPLEYKPPPNTKKRKTRHGHRHLHFPHI